MVVHSTQISGLNIFIANEIPIGDIDGVNKVFILANTPIDGTVMVFLGTVQVPGTNKDFEINNNIITFVKAPKIGQEVVVNYFY